MSWLESDYGWFSKWCIKKTHHAKKNKFLTEERIQRMWAGKRFHLYVLTSRLLYYIKKNPAKCQNNRFVIHWQWGDIMIMKLTSWKSPNVSPFDLHDIFVVNMIIFISEPLVETRWTGLYKQKEAEADMKTSALTLSCSQLKQYDIISGMLSIQYKMAGGRIPNTWEGIRVNT